MDDGTRTRIDHASSVQRDTRHGHHRHRSSVAGRSHGGHDGGNNGRSGCSSGLDAGLGVDVVVADVDATRDSVVTTIVDTQEGILGLGIVARNSDSDSTVLVNKSAFSKDGSFNVKAVLVVPEFNADIGTRTNTVSVKDDWVRTAGSPDSTSRNI